MIGLRAGKSVFDLIMEVIEEGEWGIHNVFKAWRRPLCWRAHGSHCRKPCGWDDGGRPFQGCDLPREVVASDGPIGNEVVPG